MKRKLILTESEMVSLVKKIISEQYDADKLYSRNYVIDRLYNGPRELRKYVKGLPHIDCYDSKGSKHVCTKIPEVIYVYLTGRY
jgi:hypothetical protein